MKLCEVTLVAQKFTCSKSSAINTSTMNYYKDLNGNLYYSAISVMLQLIYIYLSQRQDLTEITAALQESAHLFKLCSFIKRPAVTPETSGEHTLRVIKVILSFSWCNQKLLFSSFFAGHFICFVLCANCFGCYTCFIFYRWLPYP